MMLATVDAPPGHGFLPVEPDPDTAPYWQGLAAGRLLLPRCRACRQLWAPPSASCPYCGHRGSDWTEHDGRGHVYSWVVVHRALDDAFRADVPCTIAVVTLDEADGARLVGRLLSRDAPSASATVRAGLPVQAVAYRVADQTLPGFVPLT